MGTESQLGTVGVTRRNLGAVDSARANRLWWDADAASYHLEHGAFLGTDEFVWCPENLREDEAALLGPVESLRGAAILEVGCGSAMCSRWLADRGAKPTAFDISYRMLVHGRQASPGSDQRPGKSEVSLVQADAQVLPFLDDSFDLAFSAFGAVPFVADAGQVMAEVARVVRPGGRWVFSTSHPIRWCFPDSPDADGLVAGMPYFDRRPYVEFDDDGRPTYVEHHRTVGDRVREIVAAGFRLVDLIEPEWPAEFDGVWGGWSPLRGRILPGTAIYVCELPQL